jgi:hypothetical protein
MESGKPQRINEDMPLAALDVLVGIIATDPG